MLDVPWPGCPTRRGRRPRRRRAGPSPTRSATSPTSTARWSSPPPILPRSRRTATPLLADPGNFDMAGPWAADAPADLLARWREARPGIRDAFAGLGARDRLPWYGPPMSARSSITARLDGDVGPRRRRHRRSRPPALVVGPTAPRRPPRGRHPWLQLRRAGPGGAGRAGGRRARRSRRRPLDLGRGRRRRARSRARPSTSASPSPSVARSTTSPSPPPARRGRLARGGPGVRRRPDHHDEGLTVVSPLQRYDLVPTSALAVGAHPDDVEFGCGGTLARWAVGRLHRAPPRPHRRVQGDLGPPTPTPTPW